MIADAGEAARYWPRWRGPSGQGLVAGTRLSRHAGRPPRTCVWKSPVPGSGNSSPIVWGDRIFLTTAYDNGNGSSVLAFRRTDGRQLWETVAPDGARRSAALQERLRVGHAVPPTASASTSRSARAGLMAVDMNGKLVWHRDLGRDRELSRPGRVAAALQGPRDPLSGSARRLVHRGVRHATGQAVVADAARRHRRLGHADRDPRRRPRRDHRQRPEPRASPTTPIRAPSCGAAAAPPSR